LLLLLSSSSSSSLSFCLFLLHSDSQGKVWIGSASKIFGAHYPQLAKLKNRALLLTCHHATVFGAVCAILGV
jgi:hypothetical protein